MNLVKTLAVVTAFLCAATVANAEGLKIGGKINYFAVQPTGDDADDYDMSFLGFGAGVALEVPLGPVTLNPGVEFYYSKPFSMEYDIGASDKAKASITELGISIPVVVQYGISDAYVGAGVQANLPLSSKQKTEIPEMSMMGIVVPAVDEEEDTENRSAVDFGIAIVAGYNINSNISVGAKAVIGLTTCDSEGEANVKYNQYGLGVTYFF